MTKHLLLIGYGYSARALAGLALARGWRVSGTTRSAEKAGRMKDAGVGPILFDGEAPAPALAETLAAADAIAVSARGTGAIDPVPHALVLTGIVVAASATALGVVLMLRMPAASAESPGRPEDDGAKC